MRCICILLLAIISLPSPAQKTITGTVTDAETKKPLQGASVFLSNTSIGTVAKADGHFAIRIPQGKFEIVASNVGYETRVFASADVDSILNISLKPKANELEGVVLQPIESNGWEKWGRTFMENFIGTTDESQQCRLENEEAVKFRYDKKKNLLTAFSREPLVIINKALGYTIKYQLEEFSYDFKNRLLYYEGYPLFENMEGGEARRKRWNKHRQDVYEGSMMHFMRSIYRNKLEQDGFNVYRLKKIKNVEKERIRSVLLRQAKPKDSSNYYDNILSEPDEKDVVYSGKLSGDSIAFAFDSTTAGLEFENYLYILYTRKKAEPTYQRLYPRSGNQRASQITLTEPGALQIEASGSFFPIRSLMSSGYWSWSEKIATMLPFDYSPPKVAQ